MNKEFIAYLAEVFRSFGPIEAKRMFSGHGIYRDGLIFGLVIDDVLYLKTDPETQAEFEAAGSVPFQFEKAGKTVKTSYLSAPEIIFEDSQEAKRWATMAYAASLRAEARKKPKKARKSS